MSRNIHHIAFLLLILMGVSPAAQTPVAAPSDLDSYVKQVMEEFEVPGVSVALVKDG